MESIRCAGTTDIGKKRETNEDQFLIARLRKSLIVERTSIADDYAAKLVSEDEGLLMVVADGMGGHRAGEVASQVAIDSAVAYVLNAIPWFYRLSDDSDDDLEAELKQALVFCQQQLVARSTSDPTLRDMGTTLTLGYIIGRSLYVVHVGDSRCYLLREGSLHQITRDHTIGQAMVDQGVLSATALPMSHLSHVLWNAVGGSEHSEVKPDVMRCELNTGDHVLLCSDGLSRYLDHDAITKILGNDIPLQQQCDRLIGMANKLGGADNITVIVAAVDKINSSSGLTTPASAMRKQTNLLADTDQFANGSG